MLCTVLGTGFTKWSTLKLSDGLELEDFYSTLWINQNSVLLILVKQLNEFNAKKCAHDSKPGKNWYMWLKPKSVQDCQNSGMKKHCLDIQAKILRSTTKQVTF